MIEDSIFTRIIKGEVPCHKIYEDAKTFAFLDIHPVNRGHTLVVSKKQVEFVWDLEDSDYQAVMHTAKLVAARLQEVLGFKHVGEQIVGVDVPHAHIHVIPFNDVAEYRNKPDMNAEPDHAALADLAKELAF